MKFFPRYLAECHCKIPDWSNVSSFMGREKRMNREERFFVNKIWI